MADTAKTTVVVPPQSPEERAAELADIRRWRIVLVVAAVVFVALTIGLQVWSSVQTSSTKVVTTGTDAETKNGTVTTTVKKGPPDTLVSTSMGAAAALLAAAAFYGRIKKFSFGGADIELSTAAGLTEPETKAVVQEAAKQADAEGLEEDKPAVVASALDSARGTKAMLRSGVAPDDAPDGLELLRDPDALANYSANRAVHKFKTDR
jgi:hypothetical protein